MLVVLAGMEQCCVKIVDKALDRGVTGFFFKHFFIAGTHALRHFTLAHEGADEGAGGRKVVDGIAEKLFKIILSK